MMPISKHLVMPCLAVAVITGYGTTAWAGNKEDFDAEALYRASCAPCHGMTGSGDGPVAEVLLSEVPPLNTLLKRHDGLFPSDYVHEIIDGRRTLSAHGSREMPVWGLRYGGAPPAGTDTSSAAAEGWARQKIQSLVAYIRSIQVE